MKKLPAPPPWLHDSHPEYWVTLSVAARFYFRKHVSTINRAVHDGTLAEAGIPTFFDGFRWYLRIPRLLESVQSARHSA